MNAILVAMHLVACQPDLLICDDMSVSSKRWTDMETCRQDQSTERVRVKQGLPDGTVVMSRCRYLIGRDHRSVPTF